MFVRAGLPSPRSGNTMSRLQMAVPGPRFRPGPGTTRGGRNGEWVPLSSATGADSYANPELHCQLETPSDEPYGDDHPYGPVQSPSL